MKNPCEDCLTLSICNNQSIGKLIIKCDLLRVYFSKSEDENVKRAYENVQKYWIRKLRIKFGMPTTNKVIDIPEWNLIKQINL